MPTQPRTTRTRTLWAALALGAGTLSAGAQMDVFDPPPPPDAPAEAPAPGETLRGPEVEHEGEPGRRAAFGDDDRTGGVNLMAALREVRSLRGQGTPESERLTPEQAREIMGITRAFQQERRAHMQAHKGEFDELRAVLGDLAPEPRDTARRGRADANERAGARGQRQRSDQQSDADTPPGERDERRARRARGGRESETAGAERARRDRPEPTPEQAEALKAWRKLMSAGPSPEAALEQVMDVLTEEQRRVVGERLERRRRGAEQNRGAAERERPAERRPAPAMDSVDVPTPGDG